MALAKNTQDQILVLFFRLKLFKSFKLFPLRSGAELLDDLLKHETLNPKRRRVRFSSKSLSSERSERGTNQTFFYFHLECEKSRARIWP